MEKLEAELEHHKNVLPGADKAYIEKKRIFWDSVLDLVRKHNGGKIGRPVLEVGNGPFGAFLALDGKDTVCVDPLNGEYRKFPHFSALRSRFIDSGMESVGDIGRFSTIISYNALDHVDDPEKTVARMLELSSEDAIFLIGVDYYGSGLLKGFMHAFRRQIDAPHPHHFGLGELKAMFGKDFEILEIAGNSGFKAFGEKLPEQKGLSAVSSAYRLAYSIGKRFGMGGKEANLGIKKMAVFVMRKKSAVEE